MKFGSKTLCGAQILISVSSFAAAVTELSSLEYTTNTGVSKLHTYLDKTVLHCCSSGLSVRHSIFFFRNKYVVCIYALFLKALVRKKSLCSTIHDVKRNGSIYKSRAFLDRRNTVEIIDCDAHLSISFSFTKSIIIG